MITNIIFISHFVIFNWFIFDIFLAFYISLENHTGQYTPGFTAEFIDPKNLCFLKNDLLELIWNPLCRYKQANSEYIYYFSFRPSFREISRFFIVQDNNLKITIFSERRLGMENNIYIYIFRISSFRSTKWYQYWVYTKILRKVI